MRRKRHRETKVWRDPHLAATGRRKKQSNKAANSDKSNKPVPKEARGRRRSKQRSVDPERRAAARIISGPQNDIDPKEAERERLLSRLLNVEGRPAICKAAQAYLEGGFEFPLNQGVWLQLLEHRDEAMVTQAIEKLAELIAEEPPYRRAVLESRLRRLEEYADEDTTKAAAGELRRSLPAK